MASSCSTTSTVLSFAVQIAQGADQPLVVARVQADRRLVEDVADARQPAADAGGQADALQFAARERVAGPVEREVIEADLVQKAEAGGDFAEDRAGDLGVEEQRGSGFGVVGVRRIVEYQVLST